MHDLRILNGIVVSDGSVLRADIGIEGSQIAEIGPPGAVGRARAEIDASGLHVLPGAIDVHFHCRSPSHPERGDFASETAAAAAGGVTTVFEMPISDPACSTPAVFQDRRDLASTHAHVNVGLYSGAVLGSRAETTQMAELGAIGFKLFTIEPAPGRAREFAGLWTTNEGRMMDTFEAVQTTGLPCVVHAENNHLVHHFARRSTGGIPLRPPVIEATAIAVVSLLAKETGVHAHIAHVSSRAALAAVVAGRNLGARISAETCPQYLALDESVSRTKGAVAKVAPPLRQPDDVDALWEALASGQLSVLASDHSPFLAHEKTTVWANAPQGLPTVELLLPVILDGAVRGRLPLPDAVSAVTSTPAKLFGIYPRKGVVALGADADLTLVALGQNYRPTPETLLTRAAGCAVAFSDLEFRARVEHTVVNGVLVYTRGAITTTNAGLFVPGPAATEESISSVS